MKHFCNFNDSCEGLILGHHVAILLITALDDLKEILRVAPSIVSLQLLLGFNNSGVWCLEPHFVTGFTFVVFTFSSKVGTD